MKLKDTTNAGVPTAVAERAESGTRGQSVAARGARPAQAAFAASEVTRPASPAMGSVPRPSPSIPTALAAPATSPLTPSDEAYAAMDGEKARAIAALLRGGTLQHAADAASRIAALHGKQRHADEVAAMADRLIENASMRAQVKLAASLVVLGEWKSPASVMLGGRLSDEDKRAHIFPINKRAAEVLRQLPDGEALARAVEGTQPEGVTPWLHATRDISAMDAPRKWRVDERHPDGRLSLAEVELELTKNDARPGRAPEVTAELLARYRAVRGG